MVVADELHFTALDNVRVANCRNSSGTEYPNTFMAAHRSRLEAYIRKLKQSTRNYGLLIPLSSVLSIVENEDVFIIKM